MRLRTQASIVGMVLAFSSMLANALGLGEIKLNTALNQPLSAEIPLLNVRELTEEEIIARIASNDDFERLGIEKTFFLSGIEFEVELNAPNGPTLFLSTDDAVSEPFLNFAIQIEWPSGKLLREYTVLMDLPVYTDGVVQPVNPPREPVYTPPATTSTQQAPATRPSQPSYDSDSYGPTGANDNLWTIASRTKPSGVSIQQAMLAIQRANPDAFIRDNINLLKRGKVLRIPDADEMRALARGEAVREVAQQNAAFRNKTPEPSDSLPQLEGSKTFEPTVIEETPVEGRVKLSTGDTEGQQGVGTEDQAEIDAIQEELNVTEEQLDAATRENRELQDRARSMEEQIDTLEKLIEINNEEMRNLELLAQQQNEAADALVEDTLDSEVTDIIEDATEEVTDIVDETGAQLSDAIADVTDGVEETVDDGVEAVQETVDGITDEVSDVVDDVETAIADVDPEPTVDSAPEVTEAKPPVVTIPKAPEKGIVEVLMDNLLYILIGVGVLIAGLVGFFFVRRGSDSFDDDDFDDMDDEDFEEAQGEDLEDATVPMYADEDQALPSDEEIAADLASDELDFEESSEAETEDVVAECDIHIAYGQYDQAEEKLLNALESEPADAQVRLKLMEVYAVQGDADKFDMHYANLHELNEPDVLDRAATMRDGIEDAGVFDRSAHNTSDFVAMLGGVASSAAAAVGLSALTDDSESAESDLGLDLELDDEDVTRIAPHNTDALDDELRALDADLASDELDLDLSLGDDGDADDTLDNLDEAFELDASLDEDSFELDASDFDESEELEDISSDAELLNPEFADSLVTETGEAHNTAKSSEETESFDLDADLDDILGEDAVDTVDAVEEGLANADLDDLDLGDLESDLESELDAPVETPSASADDLDLDGDFNLDELDQELDQLASDFDGDFGDLESDLSLDDAPSAPKVEIPESIAELDELDTGLEEVSEDAVAVPEDASETDIPDFDPDEDDDSSLGFLSDSDEVATKLDLARAYIDMGDADGAKDIIDEIMEEGNSEQKVEAQSLLEKI